MVEEEAEERAWRATLWSAEGVGAVRYRRLLEHFGSARAAFEAGPEACAGALRAPHLLGGFRGGWGDELRTALEAGLDDLCAKAIPRGDPRYPVELDAADGPGWIFVRGSVEALSGRFAAIVGTRRIRTDGATLARQAVRWATRRGWWIASGGARGVDAEAHREAVAQAVPTTVVLPAGLAHPTPPSHRRLFDSVCEGGGCLLSEHPPWRPPRPELFVRRNRLISGLSVLTLVVRAPRRSGALVTAEWARRQGRRLFAMPGSPTDPTAAGCLKLLHEGATLLTAASDLPRARCEPGSGSTQELDSPAPRPTPGPELVPVLEALRQGAATGEALAVAVGMSAQEALAATTRLLLTGHIEQVGPGVFRVAD